MMVFTKNNVRLADGTSTTGFHAAWRVSQGLQTDHLVSPKLNCALIGVGIPLEGQSETFLPILAFNDESEYVFPQR